MHALHNAELLRETLPRKLTQPVPLFTDRQALHLKLAAGLRISRPLKRKLAAEKSVKTRAENKKQRESGKGSTDLNSDIGMNLE